MPLGLWKIQLNVGIWSFKLRRLGKDDSIGSQSFNRCSLLANPSEFSRGKMQKEVKVKFWTHWLITPFANRRSSCCWISFTEHLNDDLITWKLVWRQKMFPTCDRISREVDKSASTVGKRRIESRFAFLARYCCRRTAASPSQIGFTLYLALSTRCSRFSPCSGIREMHI